MNNCNFLSERIRLSSARSTINAGEGHVISELLATSSGLRRLGRVDKFEPVSGGGDMNHAEEAVGKLVVAGGDGGVNLEVAKHALDAVALLVERLIMLDLHAAD